MSLTYEQLVAAWSADRLSREQVIAWFQDDRWEQHQVLFAHRHSCEPALFHQELVEAFWSEERRLGVFAFRGGAKSTIAEEFIALGAARARAGRPSASPRSSASSSAMTTWLIFMVSKLAMSGRK